LIAAMLAGSRPDFSDFCSEVNGHPRRMFQVFHSTGKGLGDSTPEIPQMADPG
jgi:hypothetical protein